MLKDILLEQQGQVNHFFASLDSVQAERVVDACMKCTGLIVLTGVGKSGIIAEKIAMTLVSTGTKALYLSVSNFLHGDIGILSSQDLLLLLSKSGETEELLQLLPYARRRGVPLIALVSNPKSRLARESDLFLHLPMQKELCPFDLAPTTSTAIQLLFGDALAVALMRAKNLSLEQYAQNHPAGSIGKKTRVKVDELMLQGEEIPLCGIEERLETVLDTLSKKKCGCLLVVDKNKSLHGIFTDGDLRRALQTHGPKVLQRSMAELMTSSPLFVQKGQLAWEALRLMQKDPKKWVMVIPVVEGDRVEGILRLHDIVHAGIA